MPYPGIQTFLGYPINVGGKKLALSPNTHSGPASYVQVVSLLVGGDVVDASEFGLKYLDFVIAGQSNLGNYKVMAFNGNKGPQQRVQLKWYVEATGVEVAAGVNLSGVSVSLLAVGE